MTSYLLYFAVSLIVVLIIFNVIRFKPSYDTDFSPVCDNILEESAMMGFQYRDMLLLFNLLIDFQRQIDVPFFRRFYRYPYTKEKQVAINRVLSLFYDRLRRQIAFGQA